MRRREPRQYETATLPHYWQLNQQEYGGWNEFCSGGGVVVVVVVVVVVAVVVVAVVAVVAVGYLMVVQYTVGPPFGRCVQITPITSVYYGM